MKIKIDREKCIGAGSCAVLADKTFELDNENKAVVKDPQGNTDEEILQAAESCPVEAIEIYNQEGDRIYPK